MHRLTLAAALAASLALCACATPNPAAVAQATPSKPAAAAANDQNPEICASVESTGSRLPQKECHTASEWAALRAAGNDDITNQAQRHLPSTGGN